MSNWATEELKDVDLGDRRRNEGLKKIVSDLASQANARVPQAWLRLGRNPRGLRLSGQ